MSGLFLQISGGLKHSLVCTDGGSPFSFGEGTSGQLGCVKTFIRNGPPGSSDSPLPRLVPIHAAETVDTIASDGKVLRVVHVAVGDHHSTCITAGGLLFTWGMSSDGRLGHGNPMSTSHSSASSGGSSATRSGRDGEGDDHSNELAQVIPRPVDFFIRTGRRVQQVTCGADHTLAIDDMKAAYSWGRGNYGALGLGDTKSRSRPVKINVGTGSDQGGMIQWSMVSAGAKHSLFLTRNGAVYACGHGGNGRLGLGSSSGQLFPERIQEPTRIKYRYISAGESHNAVVTTTGALFTFGCGGHGRLGHGVEEDCDIPTPVDTLQRVHVLQAGCGMAHTIILSASGELFSCGLGEHGVYLFFVICCWLLFVVCCLLLLLLLYSHVLFADQTHTLCSHVSSLLHSFYQFFSQKVLSVKIQMERRVKYQMSTFQLKLSCHTKWMVLKSATFKLHVVPITLLLLMRT